MKLLTITAVATTLLGLTAPGLADARESCTALTIQADNHVLARWPELPERLRSTFEAREDIDACARVRLRLRRELHVEVTLPDGRAAGRVVADAEDVAQVLEALLLVPASNPSSQPSVETPVAPSPPPTVPPPAPLTFAGEEPPGSDRNVPVPTTRGRPRPPPGREVGLELSALTGARVGGPTSLGAGVLAFADVTGWLVGVGGRFDRYAMRMAQVRAIEAALLGGRRFRWNDTALDLVTGPGLIAIDTGGDAPQVVAVRPPQVVAPEQRTSTLPRLVLGARLHFRMHSTLRTFVGLDAEVGPPGAPPASGGTGSLPIATIGLALGATVGTR